MSCTYQADEIQRRMAPVTGTSTITPPVVGGRLSDLNIDNLPPPVARIFIALRQAGFGCWHAGGAVRDKAMGRAAVKDYDIEVDYGPGPERLEEVLAQLGAYDKHGQFVVFQIEAGGEEVEIAMRRREQKAGFGYAGFDASYSAEISAEEACSRRDFTVNAMLYDPFTGELIDPHGGMKDLAAGLLRPTSVAFDEDPVRVLRGALKFAPRYGMKMTPDGIAACRRLLEDYAADELLSRYRRGGEPALARYGIRGESGASLEDAILGVVRRPGVLEELVANPEATDRVWKEWDGMRKAGRMPSAGIHLLREVGWLKTVPELARMDGTAQDPAWHPEGDALTHTGYTLDAAQAIAERDGLGEDEHRILFYAMLGHDLGKADRTFVRDDGRIVSPAHAEASVACWRALRERIGIPKAYQRFIDPLIRHHMWTASHELSRRGVMELAEALYPATVRQWARVVEADNSGRPAPGDARDALGRPRLLGQQSPGAAWLEAAERLGCADGRPQYAIDGRALMQLGMKQGRGLGDLLREAQAAQRAGKFSDRDGAIAWLRQRHASKFCYLNGRDLMAIGVAPGAAIGRTLTALFDAQRHGRVGNRREALQWAKSYVAGGAD